MASRAGRRQARQQHRAERAAEAGSGSWLGGHQQVERRSGAEWVVRSVTGAASSKQYRCPGCSQAIGPSTPHVVVWPVEKALLSDSALDERRHWHRACWQRLG
ncbi:hypothetical protein [Solicola sp. PLA-1-18]|uniref:hypothetical protein n=1 Tax=Solicola sp. PLA-1-18 TaxID=3380532 RepID=UPI003B7A4492